MRGHLSDGWVARVGHEQAANCLKQLIVEGDSCQGGFRLSVRVFGSQAEKLKMLDKSVMMVCLPTSPHCQTLLQFFFDKRESLEDKTVICHGACAFCGSQPRRASKAPLFGSEAFQKLGSKQYKALQPWAMLVCSIYYHGYGFHPDLIAIGRILLYTMHIVYCTFIYTYVFNIYIYI